jgi:hypothetical protein
MPQPPASLSFATNSGPIEMADDRNGNGTDPPATAPVHRGLAEGRWHTLNLDEQLGNIGSEVGRALRAHAKGNEARMRAALLRALELIDLTVVDPRFTAERPEVLRARDLLCDLLVGENHHRSTPESIDGYFLTFALEARHDR